MAAFQGDAIFWIETQKIVANPYQPRQDFDEQKLQELAESIRMYGILQPLTVSRKEVTGDDGAFTTQYELIAGERRLRASKLAGVEQVPVIIREGEESEQEKLELAIIENLQREDLNAVDRSLAFKQLADTFNLSHTQVARKVGRSREYVSNSIRLLQLPEYMLDSIKTGDISEGHARTLLMLSERPEEQDTLYRETLMKKLTVREVERIARKIATDKVRIHKWKGSDPELIEKEKAFTETLGTRVQLTKTDYGGKITIDYFSDDDLDTLLQTLANQKTEPDVISPVTAAASAVGAAVVERDAMTQLAAATPLAATFAEDAEKAAAVTSSHIPTTQPDVITDAGVDTTPSTDAVATEPTNDSDENAPPPTAAPTETPQAEPKVAEATNASPAPVEIPKPVSEPAETTDTAPTAAVAATDTSNFMAPPPTPVPATTAEPAEVAAPVVPEPSAPAPVDTTASEPTAEPTATTRGSLRDRLAQLFGETSPTPDQSAATTTPAPSTTSPVAPEHHSQPLTDDTTTSTAGDTKSTTPSDDSSEDLYGVRNFNI